MSTAKFAWNGNTVHILVDLPTHDVAIQCKGMPAEEVDALKEAIVKAMQPIMDIDASLRASLGPSVALTDPAALCKTCTLTAEAMFDDRDVIVAVTLMQHPSS